MPPLVQRRLAAFLAGTAVAWQDLDLSPGAAASICEDEALWPLLHWRLSGEAPSDWPDEVVRAAAERAREAAAIEMLRWRETARVLAALADANVRALVTKGTALAYDLYATPSLRHRDDTDLFMSPVHSREAARVLTSLGYARTALHSDVLSQFEMQRRDEAGVVHAFDVHWKISSQRVFADVLTFDEAISRSRPAPTLGPAAAQLDREDALLVACIHPAMHHRNDTRALWLYDIHLIVSALDADGLHRFADRARVKRVAAVCARALRTARALFGTAVPAAVLQTLDDGCRNEPSAEYLKAGRRWHDDVIADLRTTTRFGERARLLCALLFPPSSYMLAMAQNGGKHPARWKLPAWYARRQMQGAWKVLAGKK